MRYIRPVVSAVAAVLGVSLMLLDLWIVIAVKAAAYRLWPGNTRSELAYPWLWFCALPLVALFLIYTAYWFGRHQHELGEPKPVHRRAPPVTRGRGARRRKFRHDGGRPALRAH